MKKISLLFLSLVVFTISYAQENKILVQYEAILGNVTNKGTLIATNTEALYIADSLFVESNSNAQRSKEDIEKKNFRVHQKNIQLDYMKYYLTSNISTIYFTSEFDGEQVLVKDDLPNFKWNLIDAESKQIGGVNCKKATTNFRGTKIAAWYTEEIPVPFGPWKFKGLPGLILELHTVDNDLIYAWRAQKIKFPYHNEELSFEIDSALPMIDYKEQIIQQDKDVIKMMQRMGARASQGTVVSKPTINRVSIEKKYEWED